jgi:hypothetical protein
MNEHGDVERDARGWLSHGHVACFPSWVLQNTYAVHPPEGRERTHTRPQVLGIRIHKTSLGANTPAVGRHAVS